MPTAVERHQHDSSTDHKVPVRQEHNPSPTANSTFQLELNSAAKTGRARPMAKRTKISWWSAGTIALVVIYLVSLIGLMLTVPSDRMHGDWTPAIASIMGAGITCVGLFAMGFAAAARTVHAGVEHHEVFALDARPSTDEL